VKDVARANKSALETNYTGPINIGSGREKSILSLYKALCSLVKQCPPPIYKSLRPEDVKRSVAHIDKAYEILTWTLRSTIYDGLRETLEYYKTKIR
ncbi:MAG: hypothetical protein F7C32_02065, partial [Desulfurococcales archaeon]|nr:hypothetical protein [Desulfurococcales archaeon]